MARRKRDQDDTPLDDLYSFVGTLPWWGGPVVGTVCYVVMMYLIPGLLRSLAPETPIEGLPFDIFTRVSIILAPVLTFCILMVGAVATWRRWRDGRALDTQTGAESLRELSWLEFERLLAEAFRREGYMVEPGGGSAPDGGVDLRLFREGLLVLVQCKHWKVWKVGVKIVRELRGVVSSEGADGGIVVTSGKFSSDAVAFARTSGIRLVDGEELLIMIRAVQRQPHVPIATAATPVTPVAAVTATDAPDALTPACPKCGGAMVLRTARQGANAGSRFWGCTGYPRCRGIVNVLEREVSG